MFFRAQLHQIVLCLSATSLSLAADLPATFQLDLVFPQNNSVYKPIFPFPIVFALHNGSQAQGFDYSWRWALQANDPGLDLSNPDTVIDSDGSDYNRERPHGEVLITKASPEVLNTTHTHFMLKWAFDTTHECNASGYEPPWDVSDPAYENTIYGNITFTLDRENGIVPDIAGTGPCATPVAAFQVDQVVDLLNSTEFGDKTCPVLAPERPILQQCAFRVDDEVVKRVTDIMIEDIDCTDYGLTWPNVTGLLNRCTPKWKLPSAGTQWVGSSLKASVVVAIVVVFFM
jgi:hypothetical protein